MTDAARAVAALRAIVRQLRLAEKQSERRLGVSVAQLFVLQLLGDGHQRTTRSIGEIAAAALTDVSTASVMVRRLVERGLLARRRSADDARRAEVALTDEGREVLARAPEAPQARLLSAIDKLPPRRLRELSRGLEAVARAMGADEATLFFENE